MEKFDRSADGARLDHVARALAAGGSRRGFVRFVGGSVAAAVLASGGVRSGEARRREDGDSPGQHSPPGDGPWQPSDIDPCASVFCPRGTTCAAGRCAADEGTCGGQVCPAGTTCVCNIAGPGGSTNRADLCRCDCPHDQMLADGVCVCPPGTGCSGDAAAGAWFGPDDVADREYTTAGTCCSYPQLAVACSNSGPGLKDGYAICCTAGVDCPDPLPGQYCAIAGLTECCDLSCWGGGAAAGDPGY